MTKKEYKKIKKEVENLFIDFGFVDPKNVLAQLKNIFEVDDADINVTGLLSGFTTYEVHYKEYIVEIRVENYEFKIYDIKDYDDMI